MKLIATRFLCECTEQQLKTSKLKSSSGTQMREVTAVLTQTLNTGTANS